MAVVMVCGPSVSNMALCEMVRLFLATTRTTIKVDSKLHIQQK